MNDYIIREGNDFDANLIIDRLVEYNLSKVPLKQETSFLWINRIIENENGILLIFRQKIFILNMDMRFLEC